MIVCTHVFVMRIAIFHDYLENTGGGEKLVIEWARDLNATIITTNLDPDVVKAFNAEDLEIIDLGSTNTNPFIKAPLIALKFFVCDYSKQFDFFIFSGNRSIFAAHKHKPNLWYCNSPERAAFDLYNFYSKSMSFPKRILFKLTSFLFKFSFFSLASPNIQSVVANSKNIQKRIHNYIKRNAKIVYPPINTKNYVSKKFGDYWLSVNRIYPAKRLELQLETFKLLPKENLVIVGAHTDKDISASYSEKILSMAPDNVSFAGRINDKELAKLYSNCMGFVVTALNEDFGLAPVEAMASGKSVVAVNEGGFMETVIHNKTGFLVNPNPVEIAAAVKIVSKNPRKFEKACIEQAKKFDSKFFLEKMRAELKTTTSFSGAKTVMPIHSREKLTKLFSQE